ncbi:MAG: DUF885 family protein, partial [Rubripirellula sp.]|nr:DUF885 family protein [Rubripirellula sp.]
MFSTSRLSATRFFAAFVILSMVVGNLTAAPPANEAKLSELLDQVWDFELTESPMLATNIGDPRGQDRLADVSLEAIQRRTEQRADFLKQLKEIDFDSLSAIKQIDFEMLRLRLERQLADDDFQTHLMPINNREGFHISFPELPREMNPKSEQDFANYLSRLRDFSRYTDQQIELLRGGIRAGLTQPAIIMRDSPGQAEAHVVKNPSDSLLLTNVSEESRRGLGDQWPAIEKEIIEAIESSVIPAYGRFAEFLKKEYLPACRGQIGAASLPRGRQFYQDRVRRFTTLDLTPEDLHQTGIRENS